MEQVGSREAQGRLAELLDRVAEGHSILITRNGKPAACLNPPPGGRLRTVDEAVAKLREFNRGRRLGMSLHDAIEEGRE